jgi:hypothetical protein
MTPAVAPLDTPQGAVYPRPVARPKKPARRLRIPAPLTPETVTALDAAARALAVDGRVPLPDVAARVEVTRRTLQRWKAAGLYQLPAGLDWRVDRSVGAWTDREVVDAYLRGGSTVRGLAAELGVSRGTAHTRLLGVTDPDERKRAGV